MSSRVPAALRRLVATRANGLCEYCLIHESDGFFAFEVEHVIPEKHGGTTCSENLAYACQTCNRHKGTDIASLTASGNILTRLFHPRTDEWTDHLALNDAYIETVSDIGEVTVKVLALNHLNRVAEREVLAAADRYPPPEANSIIRKR